ncbi:hypothetical protein E4U52_002225 [Claviceps spartinae]|nr:hypothetical protein E4U52_002225 [Claviceps spartinae]
MRFVASASSSEFWDNPSSSKEKFQLLVEAIQPSLLLNFFCNHTNPSQIPSQCLAVSDLPTFLPLRDHHPLGLFLLCPSVVRVLRARF